MFDLAEERLAWIPLKWRGLKQSSPDGIAEPTEFEIQVLAHILPGDGLREVWFGDPGEDGSEEDKARWERVSKLTEVERFQMVVRDWRGVVSKGTPVPFTPENVKLMLDVPNFGPGFETSYFKAWAGQIELAEKNSGSSSGSGQQDAGGRKRQTTNGKPKRRAS